MAEKEKTTILERLAEDGFPIEVITEAIDRRYTKYIAELILSSEKIVARAGLPWEYKTLQEMGEEDFVFHSSTFWAFTYDSSSKKPNVDGWHKGAVKEIADCVWRNLIYEEDGLQLYLKNPDGIYRQAQAGDNSYDFVHQLAADDGLDTLTYYAPPTWWTDLYIGHANYEAYDLVFSSCPSTNDPRYPWFKKEKAAIVHRETAIRCSMPVESTPMREPLVTVSNMVPESGKPAERVGNGLLMTLALEVQKRFWGDNFNPDDRTTWTPQDVIWEWIQERQPVISDANVKAIEKVACPVERKK
ncbi:hypothetical protein [Paraburkholderia sediminicola]|uniref:hypothetical protein n=1 Tax=Paraburkholderia sediminicola TaxID=458836 RepID=UPI0038BC0F49